MRLARAALRLRQNLQDGEVEGGLLLRLQLPLRQYRVIRAKKKIHNRTRRFAARNRFAFKARRDSQQIRRERRSHRLQCYFPPGSGAYSGKMILGCRSENRRTFPGVGYLQRRDWQIRCRWVSFAEISRKRPRRGARALLGHRASKLQSFRAAHRGCLDCHTRPDRFSRHRCAHHVRVAWSQRGDIRFRQLHQEHGRYAQPSCEETFMLLRRRGKHCIRTCLTHPSRDTLGIYETAGIERRSLQLSVVHIRVHSEVSAGSMRLLTVLLPGNT